MGSTGFHRDFTWFYWVLMDFTRFHRDLTGFYWVLLGFTGILLGYYWVLLGFTWFYLVLLGFTGFYWVLTNFLVLISASFQPELHRRLVRTLFPNNGTSNEREKLFFYFYIF